MINIVVGLVNLCDHLNTISAVSVVVHILALLPPTFALPTKSMVKGGNNVGLPEYNIDIPEVIGGRKRGKSWCPKLMRKILHASSEEDDVQEAEGGE